MGTPLTLTQEQRLEIFKSVCAGYLCLNLFWLCYFSAFSLSLDSCVCWMGQALTRELAQGWGNKYGSQVQKGYYIGRGHAPYTEVKVRACSRRCGI